MDEVQVFYIDVTGKWDAMTHEKFCSYLTVEEVQKAHRFYHWKDAQSYIIARVLFQKMLLQFFPSLANQKVAYNRYGKPFLENGPFFNWSHAAGYVSCSMTMLGEIGVDIESPRNITKEDFRSVFHEKEWELLEQQPSLFYHFWTRKESLIKADGRGMSLSLEKINTVDDILFFNQNYFHFYSIPHNSCFAHLCLKSSQHIASVSIKTSQLFLSDFEL